MGNGVLFFLLFVWNHGPAAASPWLLSAAALLAVAAVIVWAGQRTTGPTADADLLSGIISFPALWEEHRHWLLLDGGRKPSTVSTYRKATHDFAHPIYGYLASLPRPKGWWQATDGDLRRFLAQPLQAGPRRGEGPSANYHRSRLAAIRVLYFYAYQRGYIRRDPMALVRHPRRPGDADRSFDLEELAAIMDAAERDPDDRLPLVFWLGYGAVLRASAIAALRLEDFHPRPRPGELRVIRKGRPGRHRVPLGAATRAALDTYLASRRLRPGDPLLDNRRFPGQPLTPGAVSRLGWELIRSRTILPDGGQLAEGSLHWLRHSGLTHAAEAKNGRNLEALRELADHQHSSTTMRYIRGADWHVREEAVDVIPDLRARQP